MLVSLPQLLAAHNIPETTLNIQFADAFFIPFAVELRFIHPFGKFTKSTTL